MHSTGTLFDLIQRLDEFQESESSSPLFLYAENGANAGRNSRAMICARSPSGGPACPLDPALSEVLSAEQAREAIEVWSAWRRGQTPSPEDRFRTVLFFSQYGTFFPLETDREGM